MRLSVDRADPGYQAYRSLPGATLVRVYLDGVEVRDVVTVDDVQGLVVIDTGIKDDVLGAWVHIARRGRVEIRVALPT